MIVSIQNIDAFIIDYEANSGAVGCLMPTLNPIIDCIRRNYPMIPIIMLGRIPSELERFDIEILKRRITHQAFYKKTIQLRQDQHLYHLDGTTYFPNYLENMTVDGIHLNDLGFSQVVEYLIPYLKIWTNNEGN